MLLWTLKGDMLDTGHVPSFRSKKIFSPCPIPIVPAASLLFTLFPSPSRMTAFWSYMHEFRSWCARRCTLWVQGAFLFPYKDVRFHWLNLWRTRTRVFQGPFPSRTPMTPAGWASVAIFRMFAKALGKLCKRRDSHNTLRDVKGVVELRESEDRNASDRSQHL